MKRIFGMLVFCCAIIISFSGAYSDEGPYVSGSLGVALLKDSDWKDSGFPDMTLEVESDNGLAFSLAAGYSYANHLRLECELAVQVNDLEKAVFRGYGTDLDGRASSLAFLANCYYDFVNQTPITPFVNIGFGLAEIKLHEVRVAGSGAGATDSDIVFAYQGGIGIAYKMTNVFIADLKYRYFGTSDPSFGTTTIEYSSHNFYAGIRYRF